MIMLKIEEFLVDNYKCNLGISKALTNTCSKVEIRVIAKKYMFGNSCNDLSLNLVTLCFSPSIFWRSNRNMLHFKVLIWKASAHRLRIYSAEGNICTYVSLA